ncbi:MAG: T9SS type A sorting domain-containing protein [Caldisericaceae bacterium]|nr:T9SS type A sorting domain-containing protein [Caldisericaceae bacterium]
MRKWLILISIISFLHGQTYIVPNLQRDDFKNLKSWWSINIWGINHSWELSNGYFLANLSNALNGGAGGSLQFDGTGMENIGFSTAYTMMVYSKDDTIDVRIRIKYLTPLLPGSRGYGLWHSEAVPIKINQASWFMEQVTDTSYPWADSENWWYGRISRGVSESNEVKVVPPVSPQEWHYYRIYRQGREFYELYVDDDPTPLVHATPDDLGDILNEDYGFNCWNDNLVYHHTQNAYSGQDTIEVYYNGWLGTCTFIVDFVEIMKGKYHYGHSVTPQGPVRLREVINEIDNGVTDGLWKGPFNFTVSGGRCVILATAKAENLGSYDDDDDLKMVLDSKDFGYNTTRSWDGDTDNGSPKTIIIDTVLTAGSHQLSFYSESTPVLYDATVLESANGELVINQQLNETAPSGSNNYLWKTFTFNCDSGMVAVYLSGSADEESGWDYLNFNIDSTDDDELRIMIDDFDYGWGADSAMMGNRLFGDSKTILIMQDLPAGTHTLKLYANETPTVYNVVVYVENKENASTIKVVKNNPVKQFQLAANYPNPFNPSTTIPFEIPHSGQVVLQILDVNGRLVENLLNKQLAAGSYKVKWNADSRLASGIYFCRLKFKNQEKIRKIILLK